VAGWQSGYAAACKAVDAGSIPASASKICPGGETGRRKGLKIPRVNNPCRFDSGPGHHSIEEMNTHHFIIGNFGNNSIALAQWAINQCLDNTKFIYVDTGFAAFGWDARVQQCSAYLNSKGIETVCLQAVNTFAEMVLDRGQFPSQKFQWCAGFLKGLALNDYLDSVDPECTSLLLFGKRKLESRANLLLNERVEESEHYNQRSLWYPLLSSTNQEFEALLLESGLEKLSSRSLECEPCIHSNAANFKTMSLTDIERLDALEKKLSTSMFTHPIYQMHQQSQDTKLQSSMEQFDMGCGSVWGCGE
jgi:3'-phosphoadenosine 5'-phosphosulfate sulfotransferase (PAPS reductase)/FAD synthetase